MSFVESFGPGPRGLWLVLTLIVQVTAVILAAVVAARTGLARRAGRSASDRRARHARQRLRTTRS